MTTIVTSFELFFSSMPLPMLEVWGRFAYVVGLFLAVCAFGGFTFRIGDKWGFGRARQTWDTKAFLSVPLTFVLIIATGWIGSFIVLVPGAQTFESLKDLVVLLCIVLFGYPALIAVPPAYMLSDLIEGVPPSFVLNWAEGYFFWVAFVWMAYQLIGKNPDFRQAQTWRRYAVFVALIMLFDPVMWGFICSGKFTSAISYRNISAALAFTLSVTWLLAPLAFLAALPLVRRFGWFWAEIPMHVRERSIGSSEWSWVSGRSEATMNLDPVREDLPIRIFIFTPFIALLLVMVGITAIVALQTADDDAGVLATRLHQAVSTNFRMRLNDYLARSPPATDVQNGDTLTSLLRGQALGTNGRAFILDTTGKVVASSASDGDPVVESAVAALVQHTGPSGLSAAATEFQFDHVTANPLSRETWLTYATAYGGQGAGQNWMLVTATPGSFYLAGLQKANSRSAMVFALALVLSLVLGAALASMVTAPLRHIVKATWTMARGDLDVRVPSSKLGELNTLADSFNAMAARLKKSFDDLVEEVQTRKSRERELQESEARLRVSEDRLKLAIDAAGLGIWDWDVEQDRLLWDDSMYRLYGVRKEEFSGAFDAWSRCLVAEDLARATADVEAALRGEREFVSDFRVRTADGAIRIIRGVAQTIRSTDGRPVRMVGINRDVTDLINAEREHEQLARMARLTTMGELAASIAHEINQPLAGIMINAGSALRFLGSVPPQLDGARTVLNMILRDSHRASDVIGSTRAMFKKDIQDKVPININAPIREILALLRSELVARDVSVGVTLAEGLPQILGNRIQLQQVILNLVMNAVEAMHLVSDRARILRVRSEANDFGDVRVSIEDSGPGIDAENLTRIFEPFFTTKSDGMGMGLSICRSIVEAHGGQLSATPVKTGGMSFQITLPRLRTDE